MYPSFRWSRLFAVSYSKYLALADCSKVKFTNGKRQG